MSEGRSSGGGIVRQAMRGRRVVTTMIAVIALAAAGWLVAGGASDGVDRASTQEASTDRSLDDDQTDALGGAASAPQTSSDEPATGDAGDEDREPAGSESQTEADEEATSGGSAPAGGDMDPDVPPEGQDAGTSDDEAPASALEDVPDDTRAMPQPPELIATLDCDVTVDELQSPTAPAALIRVEAAAADSVYLAIRWPDGQQVLPVTLGDGRAQLRLPAPSGVPTVEVYPTPELRPSELGCTSG